MADIVDPAVRSRMMAGIRGKNTKPELLLRSALHRKGFRFRLHVKDLPGKPDLAFPKYRAAIFANGCFWHGHDCHLFRLPATRRDFWRQKIEANRERDIRNRAALRQNEWRVADVWECALRGRDRLSFDDVIDECASWLESDTPTLELRGDRNA
ncbi:MAG TPA: very short patch repair endonuclease [Erythrobacter sp.]|nr:very short patch repair endonuclease [Erythrobacter sp.]